MENIEQLLMYKINTIIIVMDNHGDMNSDDLDLYLSRLPTSELYEQSFMHKESVTCISLSIQTNIVVTGSSDGVIKFWKKLYRGIEISKQYRGHVSSITSIAISPNGMRIVSISSSDPVVKVYDAQSLDMIDKITLKDPPICVELAQNIHDSEPYVILSSGGQLLIAHLLGAISLKPLEVHSSRVLAVKYNPIFDACISIDDTGVIEYWDMNGDLPQGLEFCYKVQTDLYTIAQQKELALSLSISPNGRLFCIYTLSRKLRVFDYLTGKLRSTFSEAYEDYQDIQNLPNSEHRLERIEFHRRMALEKDIDKSREKIIPTWDESSGILIYGSYIGIKFVEVSSGRRLRVIGKEETARFIQLSLFQGIPMLNTSGKAGAGGSSSQGFKEIDTVLFATAHHRNRFFLFTRRDPATEGTLEARDVFNETIADPEAALPLQLKSSIKLATSAVIHTTMGDISVKLFPKQCPRTIENFTGLCTSAYYSQHIFHRVIKGFMIQTGDPDGNGHGGNSIWGGEFEDEICDELKHDRPFTLSMANRGPNTNGSQFFITTVAASWLNGRHTLFGRVIKGMDVVCRIEGVPCDKKNKPKADVKIIDITINFD